MDEGEGGSAAAPKEVDHELHNRQLFVFGAEAQKKILASNILIAGLAGGVGVELRPQIGAGLLRAGFGPPHPRGRQDP